MKKTFQASQSDLALLIVRVTLAFVILPHGLQKLTGAFGGFGFEGSMTYFTETVGLPWALGFLVIMIESLGMLLLAVGLFTRAIALLLAITMIGAASTLIHNGFFMNWFNNQPGEGIEFFILAVALSFNSVMHGAGKFSIDRFIGGKNFKRTITSSVS